MTELKFCNWDNRPAVLTEFSAFAVLGRGEPWTKVSRHDVFGTAGLMSEDAWRKRFEGKFGPLDLSKVPDQSGARPSRDDLKFADWDHRPAVLVGRKAFAVLSRGAPWKSVDAYDVGHTAAELSEAAWRKRFEGEFGSLDLSEIPDHSDARPSPVLPEADAPPIVP